MTRLTTILLLLIFGCTCASQQAVNTASTAVPVASWYLVPDDCYHVGGQLDSFWPLLVLRDEKFYSFELPTAPWYNGSPVALRADCPQFDAWLCLSDYEAETWEMEFLENQRKKAIFSLKIQDKYRSDYDKTYLTIWPVDRPGACQVWIDYTSPENYIYATVEPLGCDQIGKGEPFVITFYGTNLRAVSDCYIWFGIWAEDGGYGKLSALSHEAFPIGLYDIGLRSQGLADYDDLNDDSVYAGTGVDHAKSAGWIRAAMYANQLALKDGWRGQAEMYDFLRARREIIEQPACVYSTGVSTQLGDDVCFNGESGPLCNSVMQIERAGNYVLYFNVNKPQWPHFVRHDYDVDAVCGPPVLFQVHETGG